MGKVILLKWVIKQCPSQGLFFCFVLCLTLVRLHLRPYDFYFEKIGGESPENIAEIVLCSFFNKNIQYLGVISFL